MTDSPDNRAKLLVSAVFAAWLLVLFAVFFGNAGPPPALLRWASWVGLPGLLIGLPALMAWTNRRRIRDRVEAAGGRLESLQRLPMARQDWWGLWGLQSGRHSTKFGIIFTDLLGRRHRAVCRSNFTYGVTWLEDSVDNVDALFSEPDAPRGS